MRTREFLLFKDRLMDYLRSFVKSLQVNVAAIEQELKNVQEKTVKDICRRSQRMSVLFPV